MGRYEADKSEQGTITKYDLRNAAHTSHMVIKLCGDLDKFQRHIYLIA